MKEHDPGFGDVSLDYNLDIIVARQAEWLSKALAPNSSEAEIFVNGISLKKTVDTGLYCTYPALLESNRAGNQFTLLYDEPTMQNLTSSFAESYKLTETELAELYIGTGIAGFLLKSRVRDQNKTCLHRLMNVLTDIDPVCDAVRVTDIIPEELKSDALYGLLNSSTTRVGNINVLRFAFGMVYMESDNVQGIMSQRGDYEIRETRIMQQFRSGVLERLDEKESYLSFGRMFNKDESVSERVFVDDTGEFELAACFPMGWKEIENILKICK